MLLDYWTSDEPGVYAARMVSRDDWLPEDRSNWTQLPVARQKLRDREAARRFIEKIETGASEQLHVLYVNDSLDVIGAMRWCGGRAPALGDETRNIINRGKAIGAVGFILAHSDPTADYRPDPTIASAVSKLRRVTAELDLPLLDYLVFPVGQTVSVGGP